MTAASWAVLFQAARHRTPWPIHQKLVVTPRSETINLAVDLRLL